MLAKHMLHANIGNANSLISITKYDQRITRYGRSIYHKPTSFKKRRSSAGTYTEIPHHLYLASATLFTQGLKMDTYSSLFSREYTRSAIYDAIAQLGKCFVKCNRANICAELRSATRCGVVIDGFWPPWQAKKIGALANSIYCKRSSNETCKVRRVINS